MPDDDDIHIENFAELDASSTSDEKPEPKVKVQKKVASKPDEPKLIEEAVTDLLKEVPEVKVTDITTGEKPPTAYYPHELNWLTDYTFFNSNNECPKRFHIFCGLACLSAAISRKVWIDAGYWTYYPNLYIVMVGDPGCGKSTALDVAKPFIRKLGIPLAADAMTTQALLRRMSEEGSPCHKSVKLTKKYEDENGEIKLRNEIEEYSPIAIFAGELISFIGMDPYGWITFLTTIYHEACHEVGTKNKGDDLIKGPYVTLLGCLTPETNANLMQQKIISSGMARRTLWIWSTGRGEPQPRPVITPSQRAALQRCFKWAQHLNKNVKGEFKWTDEAIAFYDPWYIHLRKNINKIATPATAGYFESKHVQLMKVAMLLALAESDALILDVKHLKLALSILEEVEPDMEKVFSGQGRNQEAAVAAKILHMVENSNVPPLKKVVYGTLYNDATRDEIDRILKHLILQEKLVEESFHEYDKAGKKTGRVFGPYLMTPTQRTTVAEKLERELPPPPAPQGDVPEIDLGPDVPS